jgi:O-6-methylguanine DNA methyltransferase
MTQSFPKLVRLDKPASPDTYGISNSPIGYVLAAWQDALLTHLFILPAHSETDVSDLLADQHWLDTIRRDDTQAKTLVKSTLFPANEWHGDFSTLQVGFYGTDFQWQVMKHMNAIPRGKTSSYAILATKAKSPNASRAAGSVCAKNPVPLIIPCHRILTSQGGLGGYAYGTALKRQLLQWEKAL